MIIISDTSVISQFFLIEQLELLPKLFGHIIIPQKVYDELQKLALFGHDVTYFNSLTWLEVKSISDEKLVTPLLIFMDIGEAEAIILAKELKADFILMDDAEGRHYAKSEGLKYIGTIGILLEAKSNGLIKKVKPFVDILMNKTNMWISRGFYKQILILANE